MTIQGFIQKTAVIGSIVMYCFSQTSMAAPQTEQKPQCDASRVKLQMLGTGGPELISYPLQAANGEITAGKSMHRASTSYLVWLDNKAKIMVDAGSGSRENFIRAKANFLDLELVLFTHLHADHSNDFGAYVKGGFFSEKQNELKVYGPTGDTFILSAKEFVTRFFDGKQGLYPYLSPFIQKDGHSKYKLKTKDIKWTYRNVNVRDVYKTDDYEVKTVSAHHGPFPALAYRIEIAGCVLAFSGDMSGRLHTLSDIADNADILVAHNAIAEDATGVPQLLHMKPSYIGRSAARAKVKKLLLTHQMSGSMNRTQENLKRIRENYQGEIIFPKDLDVFQP